VSFTELGSARALLLQIVGAGSSFEPPAARTPTGSTSFDSQPITTGGRHFVSHPVRDPETLRINHSVCPESQAGHLGDMGAPEGNG
jgi:hypothetical protein